MRSVFALLTAVLFAAAPVSASITRRAGYPSCALPCMANPAYYGSCQQTDTPCLCKNTDFINQTAQCFYKSCSSADVDQAFQASQDSCRAVGVTLTGTILPSTASSGAPSSTGDVSASTTASGSGTAAPSATAPSGSASGSTKASGSGSATASHSASGSGSASASGAAPSGSGSSSGAASTGASALALLGALSVGALAF